MMAVTARAAKTNFAIWDLLQQLLPPLTDENLQGVEAPRSEALHTTMALARLRAWRGNSAARGQPAKGGGRPSWIKAGARRCAQRVGASMPGGRSRHLNA
jgi:hypothetical protein